MDCPFNCVLRKIVQHVLTYPHLIILQSVIDAPSISHKKIYMSVERICKATNFHTRDAMKYIHQLVSCGFLDSCTTSIEKKRIHVWGINYKKAFNLMFVYLKTIHDRLKKEMTQTDMVYCTGCNHFYSFEEALNNDLLVCCPKNEEHEIQTTYASSESKFELIKDLIKSIENLKDKTPKYCYSCHLNLSSVGEHLAI